MTGPTALSRLSSTRAISSKLPERIEDHKPRKSARSFFGRSSKTPKVNPSVLLNVSNDDTRSNSEKESSADESDAPVSPSISSIPSLIDPLVDGDISDAESRLSVEYNHNRSSRIAPRSVTSAPSQTISPNYNIPNAFAVKHSAFEERTPSRPRPIGDWDIDPISQEEESIIHLHGDSGSPLNIEHKTNEYVYENSEQVPSDPITIPRTNKRASVDSFITQTRLDNFKTIFDEPRIYETSSPYSATPVFVDLKNPMISVTSDDQDFSSTSFLKTLSKMENAGLKIMCKRLSEEWDWADESQLEEIAFEKRIWATVASQWLTFGKQLQSPGHELLSSSTKNDTRRVLHLHGPAADGWVLAAKYSNVKVYSVSLPTSGSGSTYGWTPPFNHHQLYTPSVRAPMPFPDNYFDVVVTRTLSSVLKADELDSVLRESFRVLRPGGWLELHTIDPTLTRAGDITKRWIESRILVPMENNFFSVRPSDRILGIMDELGYSAVKSARIALPTVQSVRNKGSNGHHQNNSNNNNHNHNHNGSGDGDAQKVMVYLGRQLYEELYGQFLQAGHIGDGTPQWWWSSKTVKKECERGNTCFGLTISFGQKGIQATTTTITTKLE